MNFNETSVKLSSFQLKRKNKEASKFSSFDDKHAETSYKLVQVYRHRAIETTAETTNKLKSDKLSLLTKLSEDFLFLLFIFPRKKSKLQS